MQLWQVVSLGLVEGITEFLPVSSTGHLIVIGDWLGVAADTNATFDVVIQGGAILAVVVLYWRRFLELLRPPYRLSDPLRIALMLGILPFLVAGAALGSKVKRYLFFPVPVAIALIVGGILLILVERASRRRERELDEISGFDGLVIGLAQCAALWPGISRSAATIIGARKIGFSRAAAAEFSFLLAVPILLAASLHDLMGGWREFDSAMIGNLAIGATVSFLSAMVAIKAFIRWLGRGSLTIFGYYRIALGVIVLALAYFH